MAEESVYEIQIDLRQKQPLSEQIREEIRRSIGSGTLLPGDPLPTVRQLAVQLKVNFNTVARAYRALDLEGLIVTRQGRGTFVVGAQADAAQQPLSEEILKFEIQRCISRLEQIGLSRDEILAAFRLALIEANAGSSALQVPETVRQYPRKQKQRKLRAGRNGTRSRQESDKKRIIRKNIRRMSAHRFVNKKSQSASENKHRDVPQD